MTTLRQAQLEGKLDQFIKEHEAEEGDADRVSRVVEAMAKRSKATRRSSYRPKRAG